MEKHNKYIATNDKVEMVHMSLERGDPAKGKASALKWASKEKFPWIHIMSENRKNTLLKGTQIKFVPTYVLMDKDGKEICRGAKECFDKIQAL